MYILVQICIKSIHLRAITNKFVLIIQASIEAIFRHDQSFNYACFCHVLATLSGGREAKSIMIEVPGLAACLKSTTRCWRGLP
mmetsp:Transcript_15110/g.22067  ORF Transcript_15110/g.22067 Transcript_15110/m.22067 type:complete len:83 (+) Transcript_15110:331-579(+)